MVVEHEIDQRVALHQDKARPGRIKSKTICPLDTGMVKWGRGFDRNPLWARCSKSTKPSLRDSCA